MDWKKEFMCLYTSDVTTDFRKALELKREHIPTKLYRYRALSDESMKYRFDEIVNGSLYLSHPKELNDPFEGCSHLGSSNPSDYMLGWKNNCAKSFAEVIPAQKHKEVFSSEDWFDALVSYVAETTSKLGEVEKNKDALAKTTLFGMEELNAHLNETIRKIVRIACFSTTATNLPMWNHYTDGHKGICLEYDTGAITNIYQKNMLFPVCYVDKLPDVVSMMLCNTHPKFNLFEYIAMHKLSDWSYEHEWRLMHDIGSWYYSADDVPDVFFAGGKSIRFIRPSRIIMGLQISDSHRTEIEKMATLAGIPLVQARQTEYGLDISGATEYTSQRIGSYV